MENTQYLVPWPTSPPGWNIRKGLRIVCIFCPACYCHHVKLTLSTVYNECVKRDIFCLSWDPNACQYTPSLSD